MNDEGAREGTKQRPAGETRGLGHDVVVAGAGAGIGAVVGAVANQVAAHVGQAFDRPKPEKPQIELPPGVEKE